MIIPHLRARTVGALLASLVSVLLLSTSLPFLQSSAHYVEHLINRQASHELVPASNVSTNADIVAVPFGRQDYAINFSSTSHLVGRALTLHDAVCKGQQL